MENCNLALRKKIHQRSSGIVEHEYCYHHEDGNYVVVDASYVFNKCSHDKYSHNLLVTSCKLRYLNPSAGYDDIVNGLKYVMDFAERSVYYPTVVQFEANRIVSKSYSLISNNDKLDLIEEITLGKDFVNSDEYIRSNAFTKFYSYRVIEWKPSVAKLLELTDDEIEMKNIIEQKGDKVALHNYLRNLSSNKKISYSSKIRNASLHGKIDSIVHSVRMAMSEEVGEQGIIKKGDLQQRCGISEYALNESLKRLNATGEYYSSPVLNNNEVLVYDSEGKMIQAGYEIHRDMLLINKSKVVSRTGMSPRTVNKRWDSVYPTFEALNSKLKTV